MYQICSNITPKTPPKCSQMAPRDPLWTSSPKCDLNDNFSEAIWEAFWSPMGSLGPPKIQQNAKSYNKSTPKIGT